MGTVYEVEETRTSEMPGADRSDFWREHVRLNQGQLDFTFDHGQGRAFDGTTIVQRLGDHQVIEFWSDAITYERRQRHARAEDDRSLRLLVPRAGSMTVQHADTAATVSPGQAALVSMSSAFTVRHARDARGWILNIPEHEWFGRAPGDATQVLDLRLGAGRVTRSLVETMSDQRSDLSAHEFDVISAQLSGLVNLCSGSGPGGRLATIEQAAREVVRRESDDPLLTPTRLAERLGWSLRQVQSALAEAGTTPAALIRSSRLARAHSLLTGSGAEVWTISDIAHRSGFRSLSGFNAAFRDEFGTSPRQVRSASRS